MNKMSLSVVPLLWLSLAMAIAQDTPATPAPPFLIVPSDITWTMTVASASGSSHSPGVASPNTGNAGPLQLRQRQVAQKGELRRQTETWSDGTVTESWVIDGKTLLGLPGNRGIHLIDPSRDRLSAADANRFDFLNITWLSTDTFLRKEVSQGHTCYLFQKQIPPAPPSPAQKSDAYELAMMQRVPGQAWIDATTKAMVAYNDGTNLYTFAFGPPPGDLTPPSAYSAMIKKYEENMNPLHIPVAPR